MIPPSAWWQRPAGRPAPPTTITPPAAHHGIARHDPEQAATYATVAVTPGAALDAADPHGLDALGPSPYRDDRTAAVARRCCGLTLADVGLHGPDPT